MFLGCAPALLRLGIPPFVPVTIERSGVQSSPIQVPMGATRATIECIGTGGPSIGASGGSGACYSKTNSADLSGITALFIEIATNYNGNGYFPSQVKANNSSGAILCSATSGKPGLGAVTNNGVGDIKYSGGKGGSVGYGGGGGGAAGRTGNGMDATYDRGQSNVLPGKGNFPGGDGTYGQQGNSYGGGAGSQTRYDDNGDPYYDTFDGGIGWISITFT